MDVTTVNPTDSFAAANALVRYISKPDFSLCLTEKPFSDLAEQSRLPTHNNQRYIGGQHHHLFVPTSGSTSGDPDLVALSHAALLASARATHSALDGPGRWINVLPLRHIAGIQTVVRSAVAGTSPVIEPSPSFDPIRFARTIARARAQTPPSVPLYSSLVSAQLAACVDQGASDLEFLNAVLVGGGFVDQDLRDRAFELGIRVVTTYGMTETSGGCVYDGAPLPGVEVAVDEDERVLLSGPVLMDGYVNRPTPWVDRDGRRWLATNDLGEIGPEGTLNITGRLDDVIKSGGVKVNLSSVTQVAEQTPAVAGGRCHALAQNSLKWGQQVALIVENHQAQHLSTVEREHLALQVRSHISQTLTRAHVPKTVVITERIPTTTLGKVDRVRAAMLVEEQIRQGRAWQR